MGIFYDPCDHMCDFKIPLKNYMKFINVKTGMLKIIKANAACNKNTLKPLKYNIHRPNMGFCLWKLSMRALEKL